MKVLNSNNLQIQNSPREVPEAYKKVARAMEEEFARFLLQKMRQTVLPDKDPSFAEQHYRAELDSQRAKLMASRGELGIAPMILKEIYPQAYEDNMKTWAGLSGGEQTKWTK